MLKDLLLELADSIRDNVILPLLIEKSIYHKNDRQATLRF